MHGAGAADSAEVAIHDKHQLQMRKTAALVE